MLVPAKARDSAGYQKKSIPTADYTCVSQNELKNWLGSVGQLIKMTDFDVGVDLFHNLSLRASRGQGYSGLSEKYHPNS